MDTEPPDPVVKVTLYFIVWGVRTSTGDSLPHERIKIKNNRLEYIFMNTNF